MDFSFCDKCRFVHQPTPSEQSSLSFLICLCFFNCHPSLLAFFWCAAFMLWWPTAVVLEIKLNGLHSKTKKKRTISFSIWLSGSHSFAQQGSDANCFVFHATMANTVTLFPAVALWAESYISREMLFFFSLHETFLASLSNLVFVTSSKK